MSNEFVSISFFCCIQVRPMAVRIDLVTIPLLKSCGNKTTIPYWKLWNVSNESVIVKNHIFKKLEYSNISIFFVWDIPDFLSYSGVFPDLKKNSCYFENSILSKYIKNLTVKISGNTIETSEMWTSWIRNNGYKMIWKRGFGTSRFQERYLPLPFHPTFPNLAYPLRCIIDDS